MHRLVLFGSGLVSVLVASLCLADGIVGPSQPLPPLNLGLTSFFDAIPPRDGSQVFAQQYLESYHARLTDNTGDRAAHTPKASLFIGLTQLIAMTESKPGGVHYGANVIVPVVSPHVDSGFQSSDAGLGDVVFGPFIQWDPVPVPQHKEWQFQHRLDVDLNFPTGQYSDRYLINPGSNFFSANPYWAGTFYCFDQSKTPSMFNGWEFSYRLHYLWNAENHDPNQLLFPKARTTQAGQAIHLNFAASLPLALNYFDLGIAGYYLAQITDSTTDGRSVTGSRSAVFGVGPGIAWKPTGGDSHTFLIANIYFENFSRNFTEGTKFVLRFGYSF